MYKLIIFDLDGTLLNTIDDICESLNIALEENGLEKVTVDKCKYMVGNGAKVLIEKAVKNHEHLFEKVMNGYLCNYEKLQRNKTKPYNGIVDTVNKLKDKGLKLAILSNKPHNDTLNVVDWFFGKDLFDVVMGKKENNNPKPSIDGCFEIMDSLNIRSDILYVGDTAVDMQTARNAGYTSVAVTWGFRLKEELKDSDYMIDEPLELIKIVEGKR